MYEMIRPSSKDPPSWTGLPLVVRPCVKRLEQLPGKDADDP